MRWHRCATGFFGNPMDHVYEDRELFADFLTTYYKSITNWNPAFLFEWMANLPIPARIAQATAKSTAGFFFGTLARYLV
jgi:hypothetical protein